MLVREGPPTVRVVEGARQKPFFPPQVLCRGPGRVDAAAVGAELSPAPPQRQQKAVAPSSPLRFHLDGARSEGPRAAHLGPVPAEVTLGQGDQRGRRFSSSEPLVAAAAAAPHGSRTQPRSPESALSPGLDSFPPSRACSPSLRFAVQAPRGRPVPRRPNPPCVRSEAPHAQPPVRFKKQVPVPSGTPGL